MTTITGNETNRRCRCAMILTKQSPGNLRGCLSRLLPIFMIGRKDTLRITTLPPPEPACDLFGPASPIGAASLQHSG
jgi:hypothetical protein